MFGKPPAKPPKVLTRSRAWFCVAVNQLGFPGLGTIMAGRRGGYAQAAISLAGAALTTGYMVWYITCTLRFAVNPSWTEEYLRSLYQPYAWLAKLGTGIGLVAWLWSLASSIEILRDASKAPPVLP